VQVSPIDDFNDYTASIVYPPIGLPPTRNFIGYIDSRDYLPRPLGESERRAEAYRNVEENSVFDIPGVGRGHFPLPRNITGVTFTPRNAHRFIAGDLVARTPVSTSPPPVRAVFFRTPCGEVERPHNSGSPFNMGEVAQLGDGAPAASSSNGLAQLASSRASSGTLANASTPHAQDDQHDNRQIYSYNEIVAPRPQRHMVVPNIESAADQFEAAGALILLDNDLEREAAPLDDQPPSRIVAGEGQQLPSYQQLDNANPSNYDDADQGPAVPCQAAQAPPTTRPQNEQTGSANLQIHKALIDIDEAAAFRQAIGQGKQNEDHEPVKDGHVRTWSGGLRKIQAIDADPKVARQQNKNQWDNWRWKEPEKRPNFSVDGYESGDSNFELSEWEEEKRARKRQKRNLCSDAEG
jgi:hypothetical protein